MLRRLLLTTLLFMTAGGAAATDYTDIWYDPPESGWGVNIVQSNNFLFMTFFLYGSDGRPTWYVAQVTQDASGNFNGTLYQATGTYFALPWAGNVVSVAGTASFQPITPYSANLVYTVNNVGTVVLLDAGTYFDDVNGRMDHQFNPKIKIYGSFTWNKNNGAGRPANIAESPVFHG